MKAPLSAGVLALITIACHQSGSSPTEPRRDSAPTAPGGLGSATVTNPAWPGEPAGFHVLSDRSWISLQGDGWNRRPSSADLIVTDPTAPVAPTTVLEYVYPTGFPGGTAPATQYFALGHRKELYAGLFWKVSDPWQGHVTGVNKVQFLYGETAADVAMVMYG